MNQLKILMVSAILLFNLKGFSMENPLYSNKEEVKPFLNEVWQLLPSKFQEGLPQRIEVSFTKLGNSSNLNDLEPYCYKGTQKKKVKRIIYGENVINTEIWRSKKDKKATVYLNQHLLTAILEKERYLKEDFMCRHKSFYKTAEATLIHELGHIFEYYNKKSSTKNRDFWEGLYDLTGWHKTGMAHKKRRQTNINIHRSPDPFELSHKREAFPINLEYFILDKEFGERSPSRYDHFQKFFNYSPYQYNPLEINRKVMVDTWDILNTDTKPTELDPSRLYQVHYLLSRKEGSPDQVVGHSMLRLVFCSKERKEVGPKCLEDTQDHLVVTFMAYVNGIILNPLKGVFGDYTTKGVIESYETLEEEYTVQYDRDLLSLKLEILNSFDEKVKFLNRLAEIQSSYASRYRYISNNCAHETRNFLLQVLGVNSPMTKIYTGVPYLLARQLHKNGLISHNTWKNKKSQAAIKKGLYIKSHEKTLKKKVIPRLKKILKTKEKMMGKSFKDYLIEQNFKRDKIIIEHYINGNVKQLAKIDASTRLHHMVAIFSAFNIQDDRWVIPEEKRSNLESSVPDELAKYFIMIEEKISGLNSSEVFKKIGELSFTERPEEGSPDDQIKKNFREILDLKEKTFIKELTSRQGYGIPLKSELQTANAEQENINQKLKETIEKTKILIAKNWKANYKLLEDNDYVANYLNDNRYWEIYKIFDEATQPL